MLSRIWSYFSGNHAANSLNPNARESSAAASNPIDQMTLEPQTPSTETPVPPTGRDVIDVVEKDLELKAQEYAAEIKVWEELLLNEFQYQAEVVRRPHIVHESGFSQTIAAIFHGIWRVLKDLKEAAELPETYLDDKRAEVSAYFTKFKDEINEAARRCESSTNQEKKKQELINICKDSINMLNELRRLDIEVLSEVKYVLSVRDTMIERLPELTPLAIFKNIIDKKLLDELVRDDLYLEVEEMLNAINRLMLEAKAELAKTKAFVKQGMQKQVEHVSVSQNVNSLFQSESAASSASSAQPVSAPALKMS